MSRIHRRSIVLALAATLTLAVAATPAVAHEPERDYWCLGDCFGIVIHDVETGQQTILFEGDVDVEAIERDPADGPGTTRIGPIGMPDVTWDVTLTGLCDGPTDKLDTWELADGVITVSFEPDEEQYVGEGEPETHTVALDFKTADGAYDREGGPAQSTTERIDLGPTGWGYGEYPVVVTMRSDAAWNRHFDVRMTSLPAEASG
jgi:hypothetical protein